MPNQNLNFGQYSFLSWVRHGISNRIIETDTLAIASSNALERASVEVQVQVSNMEIVNRNFSLHGPSDVIGLHPDAVLRTEPAAQVQNFEPNYLSYVEFYDEDFPWRYTPAAPNGDRLRPWIALLVLKLDEFTLLSGVGAKIPVIRVVGKEVLPPAKDLHLWAHAQTEVASSKGALSDFITTFNKKVAEDPDGHISRLLSPRRLEANTKYQAFIVPSFEVGRLAGLGQDFSKIPAQKPAWNDAINGTVDLPVYFFWEFGTGANEDFEFYVNKLIPVVSQPELGVRPMDVSAPGFVKANGSSESLPSPSVQDNMLLFEGAMIAPGAVRSEYPQKQGIADAFTQEIGKLLNLEQNISLKEKTDADPWVSIPFYGKNWADNPGQPWDNIPPTAANFNPTGDTWLDDINRDPRNRAAAGLGAYLVQQNQEAWMQAAWTQLYRVFKMADDHRAVQSMRDRILNRWMEVVNPADFISMGRGMTSRILTQSGISEKLTVSSHLWRSATPNVLSNSAFRRTMRSGGALMVRQNRHMGANIKMNFNSFSTTTTVFNQYSANIKAASNFSANQTINNLNDVTTGMQNWANGLNVQQVNEVLTNSAILTASISSSVVSGQLFSTINQLNLSTQVLGNLSKFGNLGKLGSLGNLGKVVDIGKGGDIGKGSDIGKIGGISKGRGLASNKRIKKVQNLLNTEGVNENLKKAWDELALYIGASTEMPVQKSTLELDEVKKSMVGTIKKASLKQFEANIASMPGAEHIETNHDINDEVPFGYFKCPEFVTPMYEYLRTLDKEYLLPNLQRVEDNSISLLQTNPHFIRAFMLGLNHEMGRELLWRNFPCDLRGTFFGNFWSYLETKEVAGDKNSGGKWGNTDNYFDIPPIENWIKDKAPKRGDGGDLSDVVLVLRGDLLKKFPNVVIFMVKGVKNGDSWALDAQEGTEGFKKNIRFPAFKASIAPDIQFLGFDIDLKSVLQESPIEKWFFTFLQPPGEPRFGMDIGTDKEIPKTSWNDLQWDDFMGGPPKFIDSSLAPMFNLLGTAATWGTDAAQMAEILFQQPFVAIVPVTDLIK
jgi:hypothetical protein